MIAVLLLPAPFLHLANIRGDGNHSLSLGIQFDEVLFVPQCFPFV